MKRGKIYLIPGLEPEAVPDPEPEPEPELQQGLSTAAIEGRVAKVEEYLRSLRGSSVGAAEIARNIESYHWRPSSKSVGLLISHHMSDIVEVANTSPKSYRISQKEKILRDHKSRILEYLQSLNGRAASSNAISAHLKDTKGRQKSGRPRGADYLTPNASQVTNIIKTMPEVKEAPKRVPSEGRSWHIPVPEPKPEPAPSPPVFDPTILEHNRELRAEAPKTRMKEYRKMQDEMNQWKAKARDFEHQNQKLTAQVEKLESDLQSLREREQTLTVLSAEVGAANGHLSREEINKWMAYFLNPTIDQERKQQVVAAITGLANLSSHAGAYISVPPEPEPEPEPEPVKVEVQEPEKSKPAKGARMPYGFAKRAVQEYLDNMPVKVMKTQPEIIREILALHSLDESRYQSIAHAIRKQLTYRESQGWKIVRNAKMPLEITRLE